MIVESAIRLGDVCVDGKNLYWIESRPSEKGRSVIVKGGVDILPQEYNARTRVHEYGGGSFHVSEGIVYFSNFEDQGLYKIEEGIQKICGKEGKRYANIIRDPQRNILFAVEEEHRSEYDVVNRLVQIDKEVTPLHEGHDFYSQIALHPQGTHLAFVTWDHPNMPWDGSTLWVGMLSEEGLLKNVKAIAGGKEESIFQPMWSPEGVLHYVSDRSGWWNLYREEEPLYPMEAEFGQPLWVFGMSNYAFLEDGRIACVYTTKGIDQLGIINPDKKEMESLKLPFTSYGGFTASGNTLTFVGASPTEMQTLCQYNVEGQDLKRIKKSKELHVDAGYLSIPETLEFPTENGKTAFGFYYPPKNKDFESSDLSPLLVKSHGGPTARTAGVLNLEIQFWTSRGIGVLDVNYGGSTGYGREYRERLKGQWGIVDVDDCCNGALYLAREGRVDGNRMAIKGGSAGGYTTLAALTFRDVFKAGASYYGVCDLIALASDTHKFESRYLDGLIGPYPEAKERYIQYSPIYHTEQLSCPVILLQGSEDKVVPPSQAEMMFNALNDKKIPVAYILFEGEGHGFRAAKNIRNSLDAELCFYGKIFGFDPFDSLKPLKIYNYK